MAEKALTKKQEFATSQFKGMNTQALRQAIGDGQQAWLENIQPIGDANARTVPAMSAALATLTGTSIPYIAMGFNIIISGTPTDILMIASTNGNLWQFNCQTNALVQVSASTNFQKSSFAQWKNERILICDETSGLWDWDGTTLNNAGYQSQPASGQHIATFSGRVWVSNNRTVTFSAPNSYSDYRTSQAGGSFIVTDETLHSSIQQLVSANNFLYIFGTSSVNVISDVRVVSGTTLFTNTNLSTGVGTPFPMSAVVYGRAVFFASVTGFYALYGSSAQKISSELDGLFPLISGLTSPAGLGGTPTVSAGVVVLNNILCLCFLFNYADPTQGITRPLLAVYFENKWFVASQGTNSGIGSLIHIVDNDVDGKSKLYGLDSAGNVYQLFEDASTEVPYRWQTAFWDFGAPILFKQAIKAGIGVYFPSQSASVVLNVDTETNTNAFTLTGGNQLQFVGTGPITFVGTLPIAWISGGYILLQTDVTNIGRYLGFTLTGNAIDATFTLALLEYNYRSQWGT
jgi:hypothetical protein